MDEIRTSKIKEVSLRLIQNLEDLVTGYRLLLDAIRTEKDLLMQSDIEKIKEINEAKESLLLKLKALDSIRERYAKELALLAGGDVQAPRLLDLAVKVPSEFGDQFRLHHATLDLLIRRVQSLNHENKSVVETALTSIQGAMDQLKQSVTPSKTYGKDKKMGSTHESAGFLKTQRV